MDKADKALTLRLPPDIHARATEAADSLGLTLSAYIRLALVEHSRWKLKDAAGARPMPARRSAGASAGSGMQARAIAATRPAVVPVRRPAQSLNALCACGSGRKFKRCCGVGVI